MLSITNNFIYLDCYEPGKAKEYFGKIATTLSGGTCEDWIDYKDELGLKDEEFPEKRVKDAMNYCRSPDSDSLPWCWASEEDGSGYDIGYCDVPPCRGIFQSIIKFN